MLGGVKRWVLGRDDREFQAGDLLWSREYDPCAEEYSDAIQLVEVMRVSNYFDVSEGLQSGFVIMDIERRKLVAC